LSKKRFFIDKKDCQWGLVHFSNALLRKRDSFELGVWYPCMRAFRLALDMAQKETLEYLDRLIHRVLNRSAFLTSELHVFDRLMGSIKDNKLEVVGYQGMIAR
jgi:hypothetical protein